MNYDQARKDHEYLWFTYAPALDMTGAYVESEDLGKLLRNPNKKTATECYCDQIQYWFRRGPDPSFNQAGDWRNDPEVIAIAQRHCCEDHL